MKSMHTNTHRLRFQRQWELEDFVLPLSQNEVEFYKISHMMKEKRRSLRRVGRKKVVHKIETYAGNAICSGKIYGRQNIHSIRSMPNAG